MEQHSRSTPQARRVIVIVFALLILAGSLLLVCSSLAPRGASAAANEPLPGCRRVQGCSTPSPAATPDATSINVTPMPTPGAAPCPPAGPQCTGLDPATQGCVDPHRYGIASMDILYKGNVVGRIDERYAPNCQSWWARVFAYDYKVADLDWSDNPILISGNGIVIPTLRKLIAPGNRVAYTGMLYAPDYPPQDFTITVWIRFSDGTLTNQDLVPNPVS